MQLEKIMAEIDNLYVDETDFGIECNMENRSDVACDNCYECIKEACKNIIRKHMNDGWTPVDERLPEEEQEVWVSAKTDCVRRGIYTKHFGAEHKEGFICSDGFMWMNTANAWQPYVVPEPYRPERSDCDGK